MQGTVKAVVKTGRDSLPARTSQPHRPAAPAKSTYTVSSLAPKVRYVPLKFLPLLTLVVVSANIRFTRTGQYNVEFMVLMPTEVFTK